MSNIVKKPLVSIVAPMYNVEKYIGSFIQSILAQTYSNWELLLVDDGSTDETLSQVLQFNDKRIKIKKRGEDRKKGANACRNIGIEAATGEYLIIFDSDDLVDKRCLEQRVDYMENHLSVDYATAKGASVKVKEDGTFEQTTNTWGIPSNKDILEKLLSTDYPFGVWNNIYRSKNIVDCKWDENLQIYQDFDFMVVTEINGKKHGYIIDSIPDYFYVEDHPNAIATNYISDSKYHSTVYLFDKTQKSIKPLKRHRKLHSKFKRFYILQYERLLTKGTIEQCKEFYEIMKNEYRKDWNIRLHILHRLFASNTKDGKMNNSNKKVLAAHIFLFDQKRLVKIIERKVFPKNSLALK